MEPSSPAHVLVVAHKTAATPALLEAVRVTTGHRPRGRAHDVAGPVSGAQRRMPVCPIE